MKAGKSLTELAAEIERRAKSKHDYLADTRNLQVQLDDANKPVVRIGDNHLFGMTSHAMRQVATWAGIPAAYVDKMQTEAPDLLRDNLNAWFKKTPAVRMVRTMDGTGIRAFLSDRYRPLENEQLAEAVLPVLMDLGVEIVSADITETKFYIKAIDRRVLKDIPTGKALGDGSHTFFDTLSPAITISNSEIGVGRLSIETGIFTKICTNLAMIGHNLKRHHVGGKHELVDEEMFALLSDQTRKITDAALWSQVRDVVKGAFDQARFEALTQKVAKTAEQKIEGDVPKVIEVVAKRFDLNETERGGVLKHLIQGGDITMYGLFNAVTRFSQDVGDYDRATELEQLGGRLIELPANDVKQILAAA